MRYVRIPLTDDEAELIDARLKAGFDFGWTLDYELERVEYNKCFVNGEPHAMRTSYRGLLFGRPELV